MSTNYNLDDLFHPNVEIKDKSSKSEGEYNPSAEKGQNGVYKSIIRFVPWWQDPTHSYTSKWSSWLVDPVTNRGRMVDCPSSVGKPSILQEMFFKLRNSESIQEQKKAEIFSRRPVYSTIIQVIKDDQNKELEGKLLVYTFGKKIFEKILAEKKPVIGEPHEPYDLINGKAFALVITKVAGFNNYDQSRFLDKRIPLLIPDENGKLIPINEKTPREVVFNFLKENSPDLSKYGYKEWDEETHEYVNQVILAVTGKNVSTTVADIRNSNKNALESKSSKTSSSSSSGISTSELSLDDLSANESFSPDSLPDLKLPDLDISKSVGPNVRGDKDDDLGIGGDLDDALANL